MYISKCLQVWTKRFQHLCLWEVKRNIPIFWNRVIKRYDLIFLPLYLEGRKHNARMLRYSGLLKKLEKNAFATDCRQIMCLYGDRAYQLPTQLQDPFRLVQPKRLTSKHLISQWVLIASVLNGSSGLLFLLLCSSILRKIWKLPWVLLV